MPELFIARARVSELLASAGWEQKHRHPWLEATPGDIENVDVHPVDRGHSRGVLFADIKPIVDEEKMAS